MDSMAKMGRPPLPPAERRTVHVKAVLTQREADNVRACAERESLTVSSWLLRLIRRAIGK
jgi:hypothetical protein